MCACVCVKRERGVREKNTNDKATRVKMLDEVEVKGIHGCALYCFYFYMLAVRLKLFPSKKLK